MRLFGKTVLTLGVVVLLASPLLAQQPPRGGRGGRGGGGFGGPGGGPGGILGLLQNPQVQKELGISQEDLEKVPDALMDALKKVLKPEQVKRLHQISLQIRGVAAFSDPKVQKELNLTDDQKKELKTVQEDAQKERRELFQSLRGGGGGNFQEAQAKMEKMRKETEKKALDVLNAKQKRQWKEMVGAPFKLEMRGIGGGGRGGRGRGGRGGQPRQDQ